MSPSIGTQFWGRCPSLTTRLATEASPTKYLKRNGRLNITEWRATHIVACRNNIEVQKHLSKADSGNHGGDESARALEAGRMSATVKR